MRKVKIHAKTREIIRHFSKPVKREIGELLLKLQLGVMLAMPYSKPMPRVSQGVYELRLKDADGIYRVFLLFKIRARNSSISRFYQENSKNTFE